MSHWYLRRDRSCKYFFRVFLGWRVLVVQLFSPVLVWAQTYQEFFGVNFEAERGEELRGGLCWMFKRWIMEIDHFNISAQFINSPYFIIWTRSLFDKKGTWNITIIDLKKYNILIYYLLMKDVMRDYRKSEKIFYFLVFS